VGQTLAQEKHKDKAGHRRVAVEAKARTHLRNAKVGHPKRQKDAGLKGGAATRKQGKDAGWKPFETQDKPALRKQGSRTHP
jgi:hypothetical protein